jgi:hypothetical protein
MSCLKRCLQSVHSSIHLLGQRAAIVLELDAGRIQQKTCKAGPHAPPRVRARTTCVHTAGGDLSDNLGDSVPHVKWNVATHRLLEITSAIGLRYLSRRQAGAGLLRAQNGWSKFSIRRISPKFRRSKTLTHRAICQAVTKWRTRLLPVVVTAQEIGVHFAPVGRQ